MTDSTPHWHVLGAGAIGCLYACKLHRSDCNISLILRDSDQKTSTALVTVERDGTRDESCLHVENAEDDAPISHLLVTTKAFDVRAAVGRIAHRLDKHSIVLLLVNGMGLADQLRADYPHLQLFCGTTTEGAYRVAPLHIHHAGEGETRIGQQGQSAPPNWFEPWRRAGPNVHWDSHIEQALWLKLTVNCIINPLTAVHKCTNGELARQEELREQVSALCKEVGRICEVAGHIDIAAQLPQSVATVIRQTANNHSSMLQDVTHKRPTEIDYINGFLLQVAHQLGMDAPLNTTLIQRVKNLDQ